MDEIPVGDEILLARARSGDREAFGALVGRHERAVLATARHLLGHGEEGRDAAQEAFLRAWRGLPGYDGRGNFRAWVFSILRRLALDRHRAVRTARGASMFLRPAPAMTHPGEARVLAGERKQALDAALAGLTPRQRLALVLAGAEGCSASEVAAALGCATPTARVTLFQARRKALRGLERHMEERGVERERLRDALLETR